MWSEGAFWFGTVIGYVTYRTLRRSADNGVSDIAAVIAALGGSAILVLFPAGSNQFDSYAKGLAAGFFLYLVLSLIIEGVSGKGAGKEFLGEKK